MLGIDVSKDTLSVSLVHPLTRQLLAARRGISALEVHTGTVQVGHYRRRRRREFLDFMNRIINICHFELGLLHVPLTP